MIAMFVSLSEIANELNALAVRHPVGTLQDIRMKLKGLKQRPGGSLFDKRTVKPFYAFHLGGRTELQFNIGYPAEDITRFRYGVAFSFERSQTLQSINVLEPKVKLFNDFISSNAEDFADMQLFYYENGSRIREPAGPISWTFVREPVFVFFGKEQHTREINLHAVLEDLDRLLPLYEYTESNGATAAQPFDNVGFVFKPGYSPRAPLTTASRPERELDIHLRHNRLQEKLFSQLTSKHGAENVGGEVASGVGTRIDMVVQVNGSFWFYEIKTALTARACLREATGQLLEYSLWPGAREAKRYIVVGEGELDDDGREYLQRLKDRFSLPIEYLTISI
jgi:hypothetical protein